MFHNKFIWGVATSAPQIEGAWNEDGKGQSIWDTFCRQPGKVIGGESIDVACDHYHRFSEDITLLKELGIPHYRLSIAWTRIFPDGEGAVNSKGIAFYRHLIEQLIANGITPWIAFYHFDLPQALEDRYGGWTSRKTVEAFSHFCETVVKAYSDIVKDWFTVNEPWCLLLGYREGMHAPGRKENARVCNQVLHHGMLAHGYAVKAIRAHGGAGTRVGVIHNPTFCVPYIETQEHIAAARELNYRATASMMEPMIKGRYPEWWLAEQKENAPEIEPGDMEIIGAHTDFFGLNMYSGSYARMGDNGKPENLPFPPGYHRSDVSWQAIIPDAMYWAIRFTHEIYAPGSIIISENGCAALHELPAQGDIIDTHKIDFLKNHLMRVKRALEDGLPVTGYFQWSLLDNFEWADGYAKKFGIIGIEPGTLRRIPKLSARWYAHTIATNGSLL